MTLDSCCGSFNGVQGPAFETFELQHKRSVPHIESAVEGEGTEVAGQCESKALISYRDALTVWIGLCCMILQTILTRPQMSSSELC